jgi:hypothetical protein
MFWELIFSLNKLVKGVVNSAKFFINRYNNWPNLGSSHFYLIFKKLPFSHSFDLFGIYYHSCVHNYMSKVIYMDNTKFAFSFLCKWFIGSKDFKYCPQISTIWGLQSSHVDFSWFRR